MNSSFKNFYDKYWDYRKDIGKLHTNKGYYVPERLKSVVSMIGPDRGKFKILDVGCGEGTLGMLLKENFENVYSVGCDISEKSVELASGYYDKTFQIDIEHDNVKNIIGSDDFDYIVCIEVLEHLMHPENALIKCKNLLARNGYLIVSFPNIAWWKYRLMLLKGHFPEESRLYHHAEHLHDFTLHSFKKLLNDVGLNIVEIGGEFIPPKFLSSLIPEKYKHKIFKKFPNLFGHQVVIKTRA